MSIASQASIGFIEYERFQLHERSIYQIALTTLSSDHLTADNIEQSFISDVLVCNGNCHRVDDFRCSVADKDKLDEVVAWHLSVMILSAAASVGLSLQHKTSDAAVLLERTGEVTPMQMYYVLTLLLASTLHGSINQLVSNTSHYDIITS